MTRFPEAVEGEVNHSVTGVILKISFGAGLRQSCSEQRFAFNYKLRLNAFFTKSFAKKNAAGAPNLALSSANTTGIRERAAVSAAVLVRLIKRDLLFILEKLVPQSTDGSDRRITGVASLRSRCCLKL